MGCDIRVVQVSKKPYKDVHGTEYQWTGPWDSVKQRPHGADCVGCCLALGVSRGGMLRVAPLPNRTGGGCLQ